MFGLGWQELVVILLLALLLFGAKRLPGIAKSFGKSVQEFKKGMDPDAKDEEDESGKAEAKKELPLSDLKSKDAKETNSETKSPK